MLDKLNKHQIQYRANAYLIAGVSLWAPLGMFFMNIWQFDDHHWTPILLQLCIGAFAASLGRIFVRNGLEFLKEAGDE